jgi:hypothetical protein
MLHVSLAQYLKSRVLRLHRVITQCDCTFITAVSFFALLSMTKLYRNPKSTSPTWPQLGLNANLQLPLGRCEIVVLEFQFHPG